MKIQIFCAECAECDAKVAVIAKRTKGAVRRIHDRGWLYVPDLPGVTGLILCPECLARRDSA